MPKQHKQYKNANKQATNTNMITNTRKCLKIFQLLTNA